ncbi:tetratricopeptide repeat protein [Maribacter sp. R77961]|uniref:tetratricopeptide repeat protein n=1 Tax=Maribacter sp. R77961 TaxID=3093871 RepID=UPI0037C7BBE8
MKKICNILILLFGFLVNGQNESLFNNATAAYNDGDYKKAIAFYNSILEEGQHSAPLYFNLGNSYYKLNDIAHSIYYYEKALLLAPEDKEIRNNLAYAQQMTLDAIDTMPETGLSRFYKTVTSQLSFDQWAKLGVVLMFLFVLLYIIFYYAQYASRKRWAFIGSLVSLFLCIITLAFAFVQYNDFQKQQPAIIFTDEIGIQSEPNAGSDEIFILHAGTKVNIIERLNDWKRIKLADGKTGWVPSENLKALKDF